MLSCALYPRLAPLTHSWQAQLIRAREERELSHEQLGAARNEVVESQAREPESECEYAWTRRRFGDS